MNTATLLFFYQYVSIDGSICIYIGICVSSYLGVIILNL